MRSGAEITLPAAPYLHLYVARGQVDMHDGTALTEGDAVRFTGSTDTVVAAREDAELLVWEMHTGVGD